MSESPERQLWRHVLYAVYSDLNLPGENIRQDCSSARRWVGTFPSSDFRMVCDLAGFDPEFVHAQFKKYVDGKRYIHQGSQFQTQSTVQSRRILGRRNTTERWCA